jgi:hypothetical protein
VGLMRRGLETGLQFGFQGTYLGKFLPALPRRPGGSTASEALPEETGSNG